MFCIALFYPARKSIYDVTVHQMQNWTQNWRFCFWPPSLTFIFTQILALLANVGASTTYLCIERWIFSIVLFAKLLFISFMDLQYSKYKVDSKIDDFVFLTFILPNFWPFCSLGSFYDPHMPYKVHFWYCFVCTTNLSPFIDLQCSKWKICLKIDDFIFLTSILPKHWPFLYLLELL